MGRERHASILSSHGLVPVNLRNPRICQIASAEGGTKSGGFGRFVLCCTGLCVDEPWYVHMVARALTSALHMKTEYAGVSLRPCS